jgi:hypothetical protein
VIEERGTRKILMAGLIHCDVGWLTGWAELQAELNTSASFDLPALRRLTDKEVGQFR